MATEKEAQGGLEWRVSVPEGSAAEMELESKWIHRARTWLIQLVMTVVSKVTSFGKKAGKIGADDPRKVIHGVKVGIALTLVSLFYYTRPLYDGVGGCALWAVMTVVVVFEFTVGGCLYKGINRAVATSTAGTLAVGIHWIASKSGEKVEPIILSSSVFLLASAATFSRFIPNIKARFDYGITIFILTFSLVAVSGYRVDELLRLAQVRICTIAIGIAICFVVCVLVRPVWAGQELHLLVSRNMDKLADSLEGLVEDYFMKDKKVEGEVSYSQRSQGYKNVLNSKASEDSQANLARWEPGHGNFGFKHPWSQYLKVGAAMRYCAYCMEALNGCINSEIQAPEHMKRHLRDVCMRLSLGSSKVLKEISSSVKSMKESRSIQVLVGEMNDAVEELQVALRSLPKQLTQSPPAAAAAAEAATIEKRHCVPATTISLMEVMPLFTAASLLIEVSERVGGVVDAVGTLATLACFAPIDHKKPSSSVVPRDEESVKPSQEV
ncbi:unnamed protein product [Musa acuminata subsp. burmannicoides]